MAYINAPSSNNKYTNMTPSIVISGESTKSNISFTNNNNNNSGGSSSDPIIKSNIVAHDLTSTSNPTTPSNKTPIIMSMPLHQQTPPSLTSSEWNLQQANLSNKTITSKQTVTTTTTTTNVERIQQQQQKQKQQHQPSELADMAIVEDLGRQANISRSSRATSTPFQNLNDKKQAENIEHFSSNNNNNNKENNSINIDGNKLITTLSTIVAQSGQSRIVVTILKDGINLELRIQDMKPAIYDIGLNYKNCINFYEENQNLIKNLRKFKNKPIDEWLNKYNFIKCYKELNMNNERKLIYMCMLENLQFSWKSLLKQLDRRTNILEESCKFYESCENLLLLLDKSDNHIQIFRQEFLNGPQQQQQADQLNFKSANNNFNRAFNELIVMNENILKQFNLAKLKQKQLIELISLIEKENLNDSRVNLLINDAQQLINYIENYLTPLERRKIQLENVIKITNNNNNKQSTNNINKIDSLGKKGLSMMNNKNELTTTTTSNKMIREISNFNDLNLVENWLNLKIDQLNSSLFSSLGVSVSDTRSILSKHEQISLECQAIQEATQNFNGKNILSIKQLDPKNDIIIKTSINNNNNDNNNNKSLFEQQKLLAIKTNDVITILDARIVLLRRTIDFYIRSKESTNDIGKLLRRLQVDNSLQSIQFVSNELEFKDVSSVVASGATILSELQQLQLAQQHGHRSNIINLNLITLGIRSIIDQLNQDLAHLKTVLNQRKLILLNEDTTKMLNNFKLKCKQLHLWLNNQAKLFLITNNRIIIVDTLPYTIQQIKTFCDSYDQLRFNLQNKTLEVEALLRSLPTLSENNFDINNNNIGNDDNDNDNNNKKSSSLNEILKLTDDLRFDWIQVTNCFDKRLDFAKKYLIILQLINNLDKELKTLEQFNIGKPIVSDDRTDEEIRSNIDQIFIQLTNQVKNFNIDFNNSQQQQQHQHQHQHQQQNFTTATTTELIYDDDFNLNSANDKKKQINDINKKQVVDYVNNLLINYTQKYKKASEPQFQKKLITSNNKSNKMQEKEDDEEVDIVTDLKSKANDITTRQQQQQQTTTTTTTTTKITNSSNKNKNKNTTATPAHQRPQLIDPPRFTRILQDKTVEPFSQVELECELDESKQKQANNNLKVEWFMNNFKRIPSTIKHSIVSENNNHKLIIYNFSPICCGIYQVRASNCAGQVVSQCRLKLSGIKEVNDTINNLQQLNETTTPIMTLNGNNNNNNNNNNNSDIFQRQNSKPSGLNSADAISSTSSFSQWQSSPSSTINNNNNSNNKLASISRIIQGVESPIASPNRWQQQQQQQNNKSSTVKITQISNSSCDSSLIEEFNGGRSSSINNDNKNNNNNQQQSFYAKFPVTQSTYSGPQQQQPNSDNNNNNHLRVSYIDSPVSSTTLSRSVSKSPFDGTPQPPVFMHNLTDSMPHCQSRAGLVCLVLGNPPPTIEWLHNNQTIATTKCPKNDNNLPTNQRGSICKLTIETVNPNTQGQYVCKASNRIGETSTKLTLTK